MQLLLAVVHFSEVLYYSENLFLKHDEFIHLKLKLAFWWFLSANITWTKSSEILESKCFLRSFFLGGWACCSAYRILVPPRGIEPRPLAVSVLSLNHWTAKEFPRIFHLETWDWKDGKAEGEKGTRGPGIPVPDRSQSSRQISLGFQNTETNWKYTWQVTSFL